MEGRDLNEQQVKKALLKLSEKYLLGDIEKDEYESLKAKLESALSLMRLRETLQRGEMSLDEYEAVVTELERKTEGVEEVVAELLREEAPQPQPRPEEVAVEAQPQPPAPAAAVVGEEQSAPPVLQPRPQEVVPETAGEALEVKGLLDVVQDMLSQLEDLELKRKKLRDLLVKGDISEDTFVDLYQDLRGLREELIRSLEEKRSELEEELVESKKAIREMERELEVLRAKAALGQISDIEYETRREKIEEDLSRLRANMETVQKALSIMGEGERE